MRIFRPTKEGWLDGITKKHFTELIIMTKSGKKISVSEDHEGYISICEKAYCVNRYEKIIYNENIIDIV